MKRDQKRRLARRQQAGGHAASLFFCSSDPDSLDGFADETIGCAVFDATAPHTFDPVIPGARDELLSFADYLDAEALAPDRAAIERLQSAMRAEYAGARACLLAAASAWNANPAPMDARRERAALKEILALLPSPRARTGREKRFFLSAHTWEVPISISHEEDLLLDTGGGLKKAASFFSGNEPILIHNVDIISSINLSEILEKHKQTHTIATLAVSERSTSRQLLFDDNQQLIGWHNNTSNTYLWANTGKISKHFLKNWVSSIKI